MQDLSAADPFALFGAWFNDAEAKEPNDPNAVALATADGAGAPSLRMVLLKGFDADGFTFYTNNESRKGRDLAANPKAALCFHWKSLRRQVRIEGAIQGVSASEADAYFASRPRDAQSSRGGSRVSPRSFPPVRCRARRIGRAIACRRV
jgi:pyridoxamine 5'-phosphate oxidase